MNKIGQLIYNGLTRRYTLIIFISLLVFIYLMTNASEPFNKDVKPESNKKLSETDSAKESSPKLTTLQGKKFNNIQFYHLTSGFNKTFYDSPPSEQTKANKPRAEEVKSEFLHAWSAYKKVAWGHDNISPLTMDSSDNWQSWGINIVDSLDTLLLMKLDSEYTEALKFVETIDFTKTNSPVNVFETVIRYLGGLLGAYELKPDPILLKQAQILADNLLKAFDTPSGLNAHKVDFKDGAFQGVDGQWSSKIYLAELGSFQLEFYKLSQFTNDKKYARVAQKVIDIMDKKTFTPPGLYPLDWDLKTSLSTTKKVSFGAMGDSFYEYLLKRYLLTGKTESQYLNMYTESIESLYKHLIKQRGPEFDNLMVLGELDARGEFRPYMDHLSCFVPGMLGLSGVTLNRDQDFLISQELLHTCYHFYNMTATGLGPEAVSWNPKSDDHFITESPQPEKKSQIPSKKLGFTIEFGIYHLRPETIESIFYAYRFTGNPIYQEWGWSIFKAIQKHCRVDGGFAEYLNVDILPSKFNSNVRGNSMESFFFAETLKYLYLLFAPPDTLDLTKYVFTTEAHPLLIMSAPLNLS